MNDQLFNQYLNEVENFSTRLDRLYDDFAHLPTKDMIEIVRWIEGAFNAGLDSQ